MDANDELEAIRARIDAIDQELVKLINQRAANAQRIGVIKRTQEASPVLYRPEREANILRRAARENPGPLPTDTTVALMREIMSACLALQRPLAVSYLGPEGTYCEAAAAKHFGRGVSLCSAPSIDEVVRLVESRSADYGVLPVENSLEGPVNQTLDKLSASDLNICGEVLLAIHHQLLSNAQDDDKIERVYAHAQALAQCRRWLDANLSQAERIALASNAEAAKRAAHEDHSAAIASARAGQLYGLATLSSNIEDATNNTTRFVVLGHRLVPPSGDDLTSIVFGMPSRPGALSGVLEAFARAGINMTRIESRPTRNGTWEYLFFVDVVGHADDAPIAAALVEVRQRTGWMKVLGTYPRAAH